MTDTEFDIYGASDIGQQRSENQDHFLVSSMRRQLMVDQTDVPSVQHEELYGCHVGHLLVVADGMGGHSDGGRASETAVEECARYVLDMMQWFLKLSDNNEDDFEEELSHCLNTVQKKIWEESQSSTREMGTTVTMGYLVWPRIFIVHAGDSRCYMFRDNQLKQLTTDHTIAQQLIDTGSVLEDDELLSRWRHVLWNCVGGTRKAVRPEAIRCDLQRDDTVLICSDGLTGMVSDQDIATILSTAQSSEQATKDLIAAANQAGGKDNISVVVCRVLTPGDCEEEDESPGSETTIIE